MDHLIAFLSVNMLPLFASLRDGRAAEFTLSLLRAHVTAAVCVQPRYKRERVCGGQDAKLTVCGEASNSKPIVTSI